MKSNCLINEVPRRSLRRATIERRVWAEPHKGKNLKFKKQKAKKCRLSLYQKLRPSANNHNKVVAIGKKSKIHAEERLIESENCNVVKGSKLASFNSSKDIDRPICNSIEKYTKIGSHKSIHTGNQKRKNTSSKLYSEGTLSTGLHHPIPLQSSIKGEISQEFISPIVLEKNINKCPSSKVFSENLDRSCPIDDYKSRTITRPNNIKKSSITEDDKESADKNLNKTILLEDKHCIQADSSGPSRSQPFSLKLENKIKDKCKLLATSPNNNTSFCNDNYLSSKKSCRIRSSSSDDNHVSLKEALAKLVDSDQSGQGTEGETVTIHPVINADSNDENELPLKAEKNVNSGCTQSNSEKNTSLEDQPPLPKLENKSTVTKVHDEDIQKFEENEYKENSSSIAELESSADENSTENIFFCSFNKDYPPPLIKVPNKPPVVKTPLKCSECPMRFCTVRSLLWHFGTHEPKRKDKVSGSVLLENLVASWDNPHMTLNNCHEDAEINLLKDSQTNYISSNVKEIFEEDKSNSPSFNGDFILKVPIPKLIHRKKCNSLLSYSKDDGDDSYILDVHSSKIGANNCHLINSRATVSHYSSSSAPFSCNSKLFSICRATSSKRTKSFPNFKSPFHDNWPLHHEDTKRSRHVPCDHSTSDGISDLDSLHKLPTHPINAISASFSASPKFPPEPFFSKPDLNTPNHIKENLSNVSANPKHSVTIIPVECLGQMRQQIEFPSTVTNCISDTSESDSKLFEKDGLVMINKNLALRIMATDGEEKDSKNFQKYSSSLTIYPQSKNFEMESKSKNYEIIPDILTIVPQTDHAKSSLENSTASSPQLITAMGKVTPDSSHIVKLVLIPSKDKNLKSLLNQEFSEKHDCHASKINQYTKQIQTPFFQGSSDSYSENEYDSDEESEEGGMVIDVKEDGEESSMDPLSLCSVTMEEEAPINVSLVSPTNPVFSSSSDCATNSNCKSLHETSKKHPIKEDDEKYQRRKYVCQYCQKRFGWSTDLKRHVILHTGERPFKCKWCPITFTRKFLLQNHMKKIHAQVCKWSDLWE